MRSRKTTDLLHVGTGAGALQKVSKEDAMDIVINNITLCRHGSTYLSSLSLRIYLVALTVWGMG